MHVISKKKLREFWARHPQAKPPLQAWYKIAKAAEWQDFAEVRPTLGSADRVGRFVVFNIGGTKFRLIAAIHYSRGKLFFRHVLTHEEYDRDNWKSD
ncbi:MAG: type II toxin-antitoxin system HigB family toxin [Planctomycetes bacterium]|nr:type II toxin-antitoxin system HigB family toxin [Planctomycetota bacterium]